jgi:glycerol-3-phosphate O-acyltransferase / dihydroxyacetone phosphate acyltransferase
MPDTTVLRFGRMAFRRQGTPARRLIHLLLSLALMLFFRRIETYGAGRVPQAEPLVFVLNHPNGLIDPALVFCALPRRISFLAKSTLFPLPFIGRLLRTVEALPVYRRADPEEDTTQNRETFRRCRELLRRNRCIAIFPEGRSHDSPRLLPVKTGAARIALGALSARGDGVSPAGDSLESLKIIPVGLYYTAKTSFRGEALIRFGEALEVRAVTPDADGEPPREAVRELSARIESALLEVTLNAEDDEELEAVVRAEQLFSSIYEGLNFRQQLSAEFELRRRFAEALARGTRAAPDGGEELRARLLRYEEELGSFGIVAENLSVLAHSRWEVFRHFILRGAVLLLLLPLTLAGALLHLPAYLLSTLCSRVYRKHGVDDIAPTVKILVAILLVPLTWLLAALAAYLWIGVGAALVVFPAAIVCGYVAMRSLETLYDMRGWFKAALLLLRRRRHFLRLLLERRSLQREMRRLIESDAR